MQYLEDEQAYIDRYDLSTIKECFKVIEMFKGVYDKSLTSEELKDMSKEDKYSDTTKMMYWYLWVTQAQEYKNKKETIKKWMDEDKLKQDKQDYTPVPEGVRCPLCNASMYFKSSKHLEYFFDNPIVRMMFLFKCSKCEKQQWVYDDGEIRVSKPDLCPKCKKEIDMTDSAKGKVITLKYKCSTCGYSKTEVQDFTKSDKEHEKWLEEQKKKEEEDKKLLEKYRSVFCLTDEDGEKYVFELEAMEVAKQVGEEAKQKYDDKAYQVAISLKKLKILELEKLLSEKLLKENYVKFTLDKPDIGRYVVVPFSVLDANSTRRENISEDTLKKLIKDTLEDTNWRLMSDGIRYRLGYLSGSLKAYEQEEDLLELSGAKKEQKPSKVDTEMRMKYSTSTWVKLAEIQGEHEGIEATRKRRLEKEPEGFFLDADGSYNCRICSEGHHGNECWWNLDGVRCTDCWNNIKEGVIPSLKKDSFENEDEWISISQLKSRHGIHPSSVKKLRREGLLHGRDLKRANGLVYMTIYLVSENQEFLKKYPGIKEPRNTSINTLDISGHVVKIGEIPSEDKSK